MESATDSEESMIIKPHWLSYSQTTLGSNTKCFISIVLEAGAQESFSGIRVIVVCQEDIKLTKVHLKHCFNTPNAVWDSWTPLQSLLLFKTYRESKENYRKSRALSQRLIENSNCKIKSLPLCTIVFELQDTGTDKKPSVCLLIRPDLVVEAPLRILYDHAVSGSALLVFLESNHILKNPNIHSNIIGRACGLWCDGDDSHFIRVLPVLDLRKPFPYLPFKIIRRIVEVLIYRYPDWRTDLLSCALVCKSWYPLVDMFFETFGLLPNNQTFSLRTVSNSLEMRPEKGRLISKIDYRKFGKIPENSECVNFFRALISVLRMSVLVKEVALCMIHPSLTLTLLEALGQLKRVETFAMYKGRSYYSAYSVIGETQYPSIIDTQQAIANWTELRVVNLSSWQEPKEIGMSCQVPSKCKIVHLSLKDGIITGTQLLWFASPYSRIQDLLLTGLLGISNSDLLTLLHEISSTLRFLSITDSFISRENKDEAYALDVVMPKLEHLQTAYISGDLLTPLSISRKQKTLDPSSHQLISIDKALHICDPDRLLKAFETTGWHTIQLTFGHTPAWCEDTQDMLQQAARDQGIDFFYSDLT